MTANRSSPADDAGLTESPPMISLTKEVYSSTHDCHSKVIRLLAAKLPWAIPPRSNDPSAFATGMLHLAPIYATFETLWRQLLERPMEERMRHILEHTYIRDLLRASRIKADVCEMTGWASEEYDQQVEAVVVGDLAQFVTHVKQAISEKPHVLIAYSYLLYIGLFEGGRLIRATLENLPGTFWSAAPRPTKPAAKPSASTAKSGQELPLRFLRFDPTQGNELREEHEQKLSRVEERLTPQERRDIIEESHTIFDRLVLLIAQIDAVTQSASRSQHEHGSNEASDIPAPLFEWLEKEKSKGSRPRDSLLVAKERRSAREARTRQDARGQGGSRSGHARAGAEDLGTSADAKECDEAPRSVKFGDPPPPEPSKGGRRAGANDSDLKKSQGLFDVAVSVRLAGLM